MKAKFSLQYREWMKSNSCRQNGGKNPIFLSLSVPCENQRVHKTKKTIDPAVGALRQFIRDMTFLMRNTCRKRTNGLVWSERCSWLFSKVHEKVISFTHHTLSSGISSGSRCLAQMLNKWDPCPVRFCFLFFVFFLSNSREFSEFHGQENH